MIEVLIQNTFFFFGGGGGGSFFTSLDFNANFQPLENPKWEHCMMRTRWSHMFIKEHVPFEGIFRSIQKMRDVGIFIEISL